MRTEAEVRAWLRAHGTETVRHPGGTLYAHLCRVQERLAALGHSTATQYAGLAHAVYGTDGFDLALLFWGERDALRDLIGPAAEELVYLYGSCDRDRTWPGLAADRTVADRFTGGVTRLNEDQVTPFVDLTIVNELDVMEHDPSLLAANRGYFAGLFAAWDPVTSPAVATEVHRLLGA
ncbi:DUF6817 domain-containing protein [Actinoplanes sp. NPDC049802]|uniref:DUF6817 domain-containing protein n=1 Tax=Actinoplanes sp. NPDC049802 TaxID=3154742 RepID=UPI0033EEA6FA